MELTFWITVACSCIGVVGAVSALLSARRAWSAEARNDVDELAAVVEKFTRQIRTDQMRRVRGAARGAAPGLVDNEAPPELAAAPSAPLTKAELRKRVNLRSLTG